MKKHVILSIILTIGFCSLIFAQEEQSKGKKKIKYYRSIDVSSGITPTLEDNIPWTIGITTTNAILFNPHLLLGLDLNFRYYYMDYSTDYYEDNIPKPHNNFIVSGGLCFRYMILDRPWSPFLMLNGGYGLCAYGHRKSGAFYNQPGEGAYFTPCFSFYFGCNHRFTNQNAIFLALGYESPFFLTLKLGYKF